MSDLIDGLRKRAAEWQRHAELNGIVRVTRSSAVGLAKRLDEAADALAASQAEVARLREALKPFAVAIARDHAMYGDDSHELISTTLGDIRRASVALAASQPQGGE